MKRKKSKSPGRVESFRETIGLDREKKRAAGRVFDKWAVYLAFTVNEAGCDDVLSPLSHSLSLLSLSQSPSQIQIRSFLAPVAQCVQEGAIVRSLPKGGTSHRVLMAFTAGSPHGSLCHQVSSNIKKTHLPLGRAHVPPPKGNQRLSASHKAPGYQFAPVT